MHRQEINLNILATKLTENLKEKKQLFFCGWLFSKYIYRKGLEFSRNLWLLFQLERTPFWVLFLTVTFKKGMSSAKFWRHYAQPIHHFQKKISQSRSQSVWLRDRRAENRRLSHWFSRGTENTHVDWFGSFYFAWKLKICLTLFSASATYYKYARTEKLFGVGNFAY